MIIGKGVLLFSKLAKGWEQLSWLVKKNTFFENKIFQEVMEGVSQADLHFSDICEASDYPKHVEVESAGKYTPGVYDESTDSDLGELAQQSPVPSVKKSPGIGAYAL